MDVARLEPARCLRSVLSARRARRLVEAGVPRDDVAQLALRRTLAALDADARAYLRAGILAGRARAAR